MSHSRKCVFGAQRFAASSLCRTRTEPECSFSDKNGDTLRKARKFSKRSALWKVEKFCPFNSHARIEHLEIDAQSLNQAFDKLAHHLNQNSLGCAANSCECIHRWEMPHDAHVRRGILDALMRISKKEENCASNVRR